MTEKVATGVLSGVVKVTGFFTGSVANSKVGKKFFGLLPGEIVLASLDGFSMLTVPLDFSILSLVDKLILCNPYLSFLYLKFYLKLHSMCLFILPL